ncbi:hypothetical protein R3P38DRAFT_2793764 [Favolaschia claudopus]|uniref:Uncharacterized protein n=1 Tax=Favolaschia claudopus TaxID=2862362 RepID=A0AAV9ZC68_9AGAR
MGNFVYNDDPSANKLERDKVNGNAHLVRRNLKLRYLIAFLTLIVPTVHQTLNGAAEETGPGGAVTKPGVRVIQESGQSEQLDSGDRESNEPEAEGTCTFTLAGSAITEYEGMNDSPRRWRQACRAYGQAQRAPSSTADD